MLRKILFAFFVFLLLGSLALAKTNPQDRIVNDEESAKVCVANAKLFLGILGIKIDRDILIRVEKLDDLQREAGRGYTSAGNTLAFYRAHSPESIWLPKGYAISELTPYVAHEMVHAWQTTNCPLQDIAIQEGLAQWAGLKVCQMTKRNDLAPRFMVYGNDVQIAKMIQYFIQLERKGGFKAVLDYAKTATKLPKEVL